MAVDHATIEVEGWRDAVNVLWRHWTQEIAALVREWRVRHSLAAVAPLQLAFAHGAVTATQQGVALGQFEQSTEGSGNLSALLDDREIRLRDVLLHFEEAAILRTQLRLPRASSRLLRGAVGFELERLSPISPAELYFDTKIENATRSSRKIAIEVRALRRRVVDDAVAFAHDADLGVAGVLLGDDADPADSRHVPIDRPAAARTLWRRWGSAILVSIVFALLLALLWATSAREAAQLDALDDRIATTERRAAPVANVLRSMSAIRAQANYVAWRKAKPSLVGTLAALTDALPDGTWLTDIQFDDGKIRIQGYSHGAAELVAKLDRSGYFANATFTAPLVRNDQDGTERFELSARVTP